MRYLYRRAVAVILSMALMVTLLPIGFITKASAATAPYFQNLSVSTDVNNPKMVTNKYLDLTGTFHPDIVPSTISFKIETMINGQLVPAPTGATVPKPVISGNTFTFKTIELSSGLNKITITGTDTSGQLVSTGVNDSGYVYYANVPTIYDIKLMDGTAYDSTVYIDGNQTSTLNFNFRAPNADETSINGIAGMPISGDQWYASIPLKKGLNEISIVAKNSTQSYTANRKAVLFYGQATFGITAEPKLNDSSNVRQPIYEDDPAQPVTTLFASNTTNTTGTLGDLQGNVIVTNATATSPTLDVQIAEVTSTGLGTPSIETNTPLTVSSSVYGSPTTVYSFQTSATSPLGSTTLSPGKTYQLKTTLKYNGTASVQNTFTFIYRDTTSAYIQDAYILNDVTVAGSVYDFGYKEPITGTMDVREAPMNLGFLLGNAPAGTVTANVTITPDSPGTPVTISGAALVKTVRDSLYLLQIPSDKLFNGLQTVTVAIGGDTKSYRINYVAAPIVYFTNVAHGDIYQSTTTLQTNGIKAKFINFGAGEPLQNTKLYVNQVPLDVTYDSTTGILSTTNVAGSTSTGVVNLQQGANSILLSTKGNGVPIELNITVFVFPTVSAKILDPTPMDSTFATLSNTVKTVNTSSFVTSDRYVYFTIPYSQFVKVKVDIDGRDVFQGARDTSVAQTYSYVDPSSGTTDSSQKLTVEPSTKSYLTLKLKDTGTTTVTVTGITTEGVSISKTFEVSRQVPPYEIVSPSLPKDRVINQNFWKVIIKAENADSVTFGKDSATYTGTDLNGVAVYQYELKGLKVGKNTIKFSVNRAGKKADGTFDIYYANQNVVGAQYKTPMKDTLSAFNKSVEIKFPKNTILRDNSAVPDNETDLPDLVSQPDIRFGIANKSDGTVEPRSFVPTTGKSWLIDNMNSQYIFAGPLFWVDGGYYDSTKTIDGLDPYEMNPLNSSDYSLNFYNRTNKWLKPTNRGDITLKYDPALRDVSQNLLTVWRFYYDANSNRYKWENLGGVVNTGSKTIKAEFDGFGYYTVMMLRRGYSDITNHGWARDYLETMYTKGIMNAKNPSTFGVNELITRGEFAQIMVKALDLPLDYDPENPTFWDVSVPSPYYDANYIETAFRKGIVRGMAPGVFNPQGEISRQDAAVMIARAINAKVGNDGDVAIKALSKIFSDGASINYYAAPSVLAINKLGIVNGIPDTYTGAKNTFSYQPYAFLTRAEASKIAYKVMQNLKKLPK